MTEVIAIDEWLTQTLTGDTTLMGMATGGVHSDHAPYATVDPFVVFNLQTGLPDVRAIGTCRIFGQGEYAIKAVQDAESYVDIDPIADRIDELLTLNTSASVSRGIILSSVRLRPLRYPEVHNGRSFRHLGGLYRIEAKKG